MGIVAWPNLEPLRSGVQFNVLPMGGSVSDSTVQYTVQPSSTAEHYSQILGFMINARLVHVQTSKAPVDQEGLEDALDVVEAPVGQGDGLRQWTLPGGRRPEKRCAW